MSISFNNIPNTVRTPGAYGEIDNSRAVSGLTANPHKVLLMGQKLTAGKISTDTLVAITRDNLADGYFGAGSILARMCNAFKKANPYTELYAFALSTPAANAAASARLLMSLGCTTTGPCTLYLWINGTEVQVALLSAWSNVDIASAAKTTINTSTYSTLPVVASLVTSVLHLSAVTAGETGNYLNARLNYGIGQSNPLGYSTLAISMTAFTGGSGNPDLGDAWTALDGIQFHYIGQPYIDSANLLEIETELADRFKPLEDLQGHGFTTVIGTLASATTLGNSRNSPHNTIVEVYKNLEGPEEWTAIWTAVASYNLNIDPARPLQFLTLSGVHAPDEIDRPTRAERDILLYDGIATWIVDTGGNVMIERSITTYQANALGLPDVSYLDVETLATLSEIRYQYKTRMVNRFIIPRFKLADDTTRVPPGQKIVTPKTIKQEIIALFTQLLEVGLIENLEDFKKALIVERSITDRNRVDVLLAPDLINQFRVLATQIQYIL